jgi:ACR3 family arsenite efflux pump ArsB
VYIEVSRISKINNYVSDLALCKTSNSVDFQCIKIVSLNLRGFFFTIFIIFKAQKRFHTNPTDVFVCMVSCVHQVSQIAVFGRLQWLMLDLETVKMCVVTVFVNLFSKSSH